MQEQKELVDTETEYLIRDKDNIEDFLYEIESSYLKKEAASNFDSLDIIFIAGDSNVRPWSKSMKKILTLIRMSMKAKKYLFASSFGMQAVIFLCASNLESNIEVINGQGNGGKLADMHNLPIRLQDIKHYHFFLENTTGDLYGFNYESNEWVPKGNCGLHFRRSAQEYQSIGKYILKAPIYKPSTQNVQIMQQIRSNKNEEVCSLKKVYYHHWVFQGMLFKVFIVKVQECKYYYLHQYDQKSCNWKKKITEFKSLEINNGMDTEFLVELKNTWDIHSFSFTNADKTFFILAECERGPLVIQCQNIIATLFTVNQKYPNTLFPLENFILNTLKYIKSDNKKNQLSIQALIHTHKLSTVEEILKKQRQKQNKTLMLMKERTSKLGFQQANLDPKDARRNSSKNNDFYNTDEFRHVGFSAKKDHVPEIVRQNAVVNSKVKIRNRKVVSLHQDPEKQIQKSQSFFNSNYVNMPKKIMFNDNDYGSETSNNMFDQHDQEGNKLKELLPVDYNKTKVRQQLHPNMAQEFLLNDPLWVPGSMSNINNKIKRGIHIRSPSESLMQSARKKFLDTQQQFTLAKSLVKPGRFFGETSGSVFSQSPYITADQVQKLEQKENDRLIISHRIFKTGSKKTIEQFPSQLSSRNEKHIPNIIQKFREETRDRWVSSDNFKLA